MSHFFRPFRSSGNHEADNYLRWRERRDVIEFEEEERMDAEKQLDEAKGTGNLRERLEALADRLHRVPAYNAGYGLDYQRGYEAACKEVEGEIHALLAESAEGDLLDEVTRKLEAIQNGRAGKDRYELSDVLATLRTRIARRAPRDEGLIDKARQFLHDNPDASALSMLVAISPNAVTDGDIASLTRPAPEVTP